MMVITMMSMIMIMMMMMMVTTMTMMMIQAVFHRDIVKQDVRCKLPAKPCFPGEGLSGTEKPTLTSS